MVVHYELREKPCVLDALLQRHRSVWDLVLEPVEQSLDLDVLLLAERLSAPACDDVVDDLLDKPWRVPLHVPGDGLEHRVPVRPEVAGWAHVDRALGISVDRYDDLPNLGE